MSTSQELGNLGRGDLENQQSQQSPDGAASASGRESASRLRDPATSKTPLDGKAAQGPSLTKMGGPRTVEGKTRSKQNAIKHGIFSQAVLLTGESRKAYVSLLEGIRVSLQPEGALEEVLVEKLTALMWRYRRVLIAEGGEIQKTKEFHCWDEFERQNKEATIIFHQKRSADHGLLAEMFNPVVRDRCFKMLDVLERGIKLRGFDGQTDFSILSALFGDLEMKDIRDPILMFYQICSSETIPANLLTSKYATREDRKEAFLEYLQESRTALKTAAQRVEDLEAERNKLDSLCREVPEQSRLDRLLRYEASLERAFDRTLGQLERLQRIRRGQSVPPEQRLRMTMDP